MSIYTKTKAQMTKAEKQAESDAARMAFISKGGAVQTASRKAVTTVGTGGFNFQENHEMKRPMHANGTMRPGTTIIMLLSVIGAIDLNTLDRFLIEGGSIEKSSIVNLKRYIGLLEVIDGVVSLTPEGHRWLEFYSLDILTKINKDAYIPKNYANSGWLKGKMKPIMVDFIKKHKKIHAAWRVANEANGISWEDYKGVTAKKDYQVEIPSLGQVTTYTDKEVAQTIVFHLNAGGLPAQLNEVPRV